MDGVPNVRACVEPVRDGMTVRAQHAWPSLEHDVFAVFDRLHGLLPVGFYYKTFIHPRWLWPTYEAVLKRLAGLGEVPSPGEPPGAYEREHAFTDVAVAGGGPAGMAAALEAARAGARVVLVDDQPGLGGHLLAHARRLRVTAGRAGRSRRRSRRTWRPSRGSGSWEARASSACTRTGCWGSCRAAAS